MSLKNVLPNFFALWLLMHATIASALPKLELQGYVDDSGAITILNGGDTTDPYFSLQALLLAHDNGMCGRRIEHVGFQPVSKCAVIPAKIRHRCTAA